MKNLNSIMAVIAVAGAINASAFVSNGSFEEITGLGVAKEGTAGNPITSGQWGVYDEIPGWKTLDGEGIELHYAEVLAGVLASDGKKYVELDSHPGAGDSSNSTMYQALALGTGTYSLSFDYKPRTDAVQGDDNGIAAYWINGLVDPFDIGAVLSSTPITKIATTAPQDWQTITASFAATGPGYLVFSAYGTENQLGGFVDNVSVPDSGSTLALLGLGVLGTAALRRRLA